MLRKIAIARGIEGAVLGFLSPTILELITLRYYIELEKHKDSRHGCSYSTSVNQWEILITGKVGNWQKATATSKPENPNSGSGPSPQPPLPSGRQVIPTTREFTDWDENILPALDPEAWLTDVIVNFGTTILNGDSMARRENLSPLRD
jgi:hypothetical protein